MIDTSKFELIFGGEIGDKTKLPLSIFDTGITVNTVEEIYEFFVANFVGYEIGSYSSPSISDNSHKVTCLNLWGFEQSGGYNYCSDAGFNFSSSELTKYGRLNSNNMFANNSYTNINISETYPSLMIYTNQYNQDYSGFVTVRTYNNGQLFINSHAYNGFHTSYLFLGNDGIGYFCHNVKDDKNWKPYFGYLNEDSFVYNHIFRPDAFKIYALIVNPIFVNGNVTDDNGIVMPECKIFAYERNTGRLIGKTVSGDDGSYNMQILHKKGTECFFVCLDNDASPDVASCIIDRKVL